jgi:3-hydroxyacyl-CoA dehydrogenase
MNRTIRKVSVLGSGIMGSRIACHFANIGMDVLLLDIAPNSLTEEEKKKGLTLDHPSVKNRVKVEPGTLVQQKIRIACKAWKLYR